MDVFGRAQLLLKRKAGKENTGGRRRLGASLRQSVAARIRARSVLLAVIVLSLPVLGIAVYGMVSDAGFHLLKRYVPLVLIDSFVLWFATVLYAWLTSGARPSRDPPASARHIRDKRSPPRLG